jgi:hypothetical protein
MSEGDCRREARLLTAIFLSCLALHAGFASVGWGNTLSDRHEFRQTQTAISIYYIVKEGFRLDYLTPVLGAPWSIPLEFPLYQWLVAGLVVLTKMPLVQAGRLTSLLCFYAALVPIYVLLGRFVAARRHRLVFLSLLLASPFYIFWSRTVMIESLAVLLSVSFLALAVRRNERSNFAMRLAATLVGTLAALTKITTFVVFCVPALLLLFAGWIGAKRQFLTLSSQARPILQDIVLVGLPLAAAVGWTHYTDDVRGLNPMASFLRSDALESWYFGTLQQRLSWDTWEHLYSNSMPSLVGIGHGLAPLACAALLALDRRRTKEAALCAGFFLVGPLVFTNLYYVHDYYFYAVGLFLVGGLGFLVVGLYESGRLGPLTRLLVITSVLTSMYIGHVSTFHENFQRRNFITVQDFARAIQEWIPDEDDVLLVYGMDWNPALPYYAERRALMDRENSELSDEAIERALQALGDSRVAGMVIGSELGPTGSFIQERIERFGFAPQPVVRHPVGDLYVRTEPVIFTN